MMMKNKVFLVKFKVKTVKKNNLKWLENNMNLNIIKVLKNWLKVIKIIKFKPRFPLKKNKFTRFWTQTLNWMAKTSRFNRKNGQKSVKKRRNWEKRPLMWFSRNSWRVRKLSHTVTHSKTLFSEIYKRKSNISSSKSSDQYQSSSNNYDHKCAINGTGLVYKL